MRMSLNPFRAMRKRREEPELNLIPMIDIMSVMVAFLLIYSTEVEVVQNAKDVQIPLSTAESKPAETVVVTITKDMLLVQGDVIATMEQIRDPNAALIEPLRTLRLIHYSAWLARRWDDPAFPRAFPWFGSSDYWKGQVLMLEEQMEAMEEPPVVV